MVTWTCYLEFLFVCDSDQVGKVLSIMTSTTDEFDPFPS